MGKESEPEGGRTTKITLLNNAGSPWLGSHIMHNGKKYPTNKDGEVRVHINGGSVSANGHPVTKLVQDGVDIILQHDSWKGKIARRN